MSWGSGEALGWGRKWDKVTSRRRGEGLREHGRGLRHLLALLLSQSWSEGATCWVTQEGGRGKEQRDVEMWRRGERRAEEGWEEAWCWGSVSLGVEWSSFVADSGN